MIIALDLETTGLDKLQDEIIEVALVKFDENTWKIVDEYSTLVNPWIEIPEISRTITGITDDDVKNAPTFPSIAKKVAEFIWDDPVLGHNTQFDVWFLVEKGVDIRQNVALDTFFLANFLSRDVKTLSLEGLSEHYKITQDNAHRALDDTKATKDLFMILAKEFDKLPKYKKEVISFVFDKSDERSVNFLRKYLDLPKVDTETFEKKLSKAFDPYKKEAVTLDVELPFNKDNYFNTDYFKDIENFEVRENQKLMWELVWGALDNNKKLLIEAPTWVWKTFAYLLPSVLYSISTWERVFISTNTKALQDQIYFKDLEKLRNLGLNFSYTKLKWKSNYIWIYSLLDILNSSQVFDAGNISLLSKICLWLFDTKTWELEDLNFYPNEYQLLRELNADSFSTLRETNPYRKYEPLYKARQKAFSSNVVIVNHSLLIQDVKSDNSILWEIKNLIVDESHNLEDTSTDALKTNYNYDFVEEVFKNVEKTLRKNKVSTTEIKLHKDKTLFSLKWVLDVFSNYLSEKVWNNSYNQRYISDLIGDDFYNDTSEIDLLIPSFKKNLSEAISYLMSLEDEVYLMVANDVEILEWLNLIIDIFLNKESRKDNILVLTYTEKSWINLSYTYLRPWKYLKESLWDKLDTCVMTSATLKVEDSFSYIKSSLNLEDFEEHGLNSDFDYSSQALLFLPNDLGSIKNNSTIIKDFFIDLFRVIKGKTLVLCTSFSSIRDSYTGITGELKPDGVNILAQWLWGWKNKLIDFYKKNSKNSVLFWTDTFWEWIDIPGEDLEYLIIYKLPFPVPSDPIFKARSALYRDAFKEYSIPKTILKLKQWFWRLIRTKNDKWIVILLDNRVNDSWWWKRLLDAFPSDIKIRKWSSFDFIETLKKRLWK